MEFDEFAAAMTREGFDPAIERDWPPLTTVDEHTHPFHARALIVRGEMWLTVQGSTQHLTAGGTFDLPPDTPHAERYGPDGARYWVARRMPPTA